MLGFKSLPALSRREGGRGSIPVAKVQVLQKLGVWSVVWWGAEGEITQRANGEAVSGADEGPALLAAELLPGFLEKTQATGRWKDKACLFLQVLAFVTACCVTSSLKLSRPESGWLFLLRGSETQEPGTLPASAS